MKCYYCRNKIQPYSSSTQKKIYKPLRKEKNINFYSKKLLGLREQKPQLASFFPWSELRTHCKETKAQMHVWHHTDFSQSSNNTGIQAQPDQTVLDLLGGHGGRVEFVLLSFVLLPFHFAKDHILYKQKNMLTVLGRKIGVFMYIVA